MRFHLHLPALPPMDLAHALALGGSFALALAFYADLLPDRGGAEACARALGWDPQAYGARFCPQYLMNGSMWWNTNIFRYTMSPAGFARLKADLLAEGWTFCGAGSDGVLGTISGYYYFHPVEDEPEVGYGGQSSNGAAFVLNYTHRDGRLYIERPFGS